MNTLRPPGRPIDIECSARIAAATRELLAEHGYDRLSLEAVAERARTSKATLYRRWPNKAALVADAIAEFDSTSAYDPAAQSQRDLLVSRLSSFFGVNDPLRQQVLVGVSSALCRHPELADAIRALFEAPECRCSTLFDRFDWETAQLLSELGPALLFYRLVFHGEPVTRERIETVVDRVILPFANCRSGESERN